MYSDAKKLKYFYTISIFTPHIRLVITHLQYIMAHQNEQNTSINLKPKKRTFYITEILMLKSIVILLVLTFFLLNELQSGM